MFLRSGNRQRTIHIHVGPHKTGSSAIQNDLKAYASALFKKNGITPVLDPSVWHLAAAMNRLDQPEIDRNLESLAKVCETQRGDLALSCEDLAGDLPGRNKTRQPYARLWQNLNALLQAFSQDDLRFYFFVRDPDAWLRSAYAQNLKHRRRFKSFAAYMKFLTDVDGLWDKIVEPLQQRLGDKFVLIPYEEDPSFSASQALLKEITGELNTIVFPDRPARVNSSPPSDIIPLLEEANRSGASNEAIQAAKLSIWNRTKHGSVEAVATGRSDWPPSLQKPDWLSPDLEALWSRVAWRASRQEQANLLPPPDCDLIPRRLAPVHASEELPDVSRARMEDQASILAHRFRKMPETCYLLGLVISYLRRNTGHEEHAAILFQRLWEEEYPVLLGFLPTRWLISTFQTFMDHGVNEKQRAIGGAAFFLSNTLKMYEAERALEGLPTDSCYPNLVPATKSGFWGLDRFRVGGTDLMLNTNALLLEVAAGDARAGRVLQEFLLRIKRFDTAFSRMDQTRLSNDIDIPPFSDCWSFFEPPKVKE